MLYKVIASARDTDDLSIGFNRDRKRRQNELTNNKNLKGKFDVRFMLKDVFAFAEHQEKVAFGLGYKLTLTRTTDNSVFNKANATIVGKTKIT